MALVFNIFLHALLVLSMLAFLIALLLMAFRTDDGTERLRRCLALFAGAMVVIGAQASGVSFAIFTTSSLAHARGASAAAHIFAVLVPAAAGVGLGYYFVRVYRRSEVFGLRMLCFVGMLALAAFAEVYASATHTSGVFLDAAALPNLSFVVGLVLVFIFGEGQGDHKIAADALRTLSRRRAKQQGSVDADQSAFAQEPDRGSAQRPPRDPFEF
ncbi:hypothetical protein [Flexivirga oryzae]|uniref:Uncharacterized protein YfiM (DUF2279 family) n=1 Tax=Flexivirga oryzae TaxID=1794944 RepID=A0A839N900_9MICO|nr:hypothetical protein [Flexivirga oryzae]MBB2891132.1 uncharacterized protein YfiM (DUF2279 family) [Flexivirga oryzae]